MRAKTAMADSAIFAFIIECQHYFLGYYRWDVRVDADCLIWNVLIMSSSQNSSEVNGVLGYFVGPAQQYDHYPPNHYYPQRNSCFLHKKNFTPQQ